VCAMGGRRTTRTRAHIFTVDADGFLSFPRETRREITTSRGERSKTNSSVLLQPTLRSSRAYRTHRTAGDYAVAFYGVSMRTRELRKTTPARRFLRIVSRDVVVRTTTHDLGPRRKQRVITTRNRPCYGTGSTPTVGGTRRSCAACTTLMTIVYSKRI